MGKLPEVDLDMLAHYHASGRDACPHPICVKAEERRLDKWSLLILAHRIRDKKYSDPDITKLIELIEKMN